MWAWSRVLLAAGSEGERRTCDIAQIIMKKEKYIKGLEASSNLSLLLVFIGVLVGTGARTIATLGTAAALMVAGGTGCILFGHALERLNKPTAEEIRRKIEQLDEDKVAASGVYLPEYSFCQYLEDEASSLRELIGELDDNPNPKYLFEIVYLNYKEAAGKNKTQSKEQILSMIFRERQRYKK